MGSATIGFSGAVSGFSPFHRGVVTAYALEVGAAGDGDNRYHSFSAFRAARYPSDPPEYPPDFFTHNSELEFLFHSSVSVETGGFHRSCSGHAALA